jgi:hypothetical protein
MAIRTSWLRSIVLFLAAFFLLSRSVYAYVDPNTGGMLIQLLTGGLAGLAVLARLYWRKLRERIREGARTIECAREPTA